MVIDNDFARVTGDTIKAVGEVIPSLYEHGYISKGSSGSYIYRADGTEVHGCKGEHLLIGITDATDVPRALNALHVRCLLAGHDYTYVGGAGQILERSPVDKAVAQSQQPIFLAAHLVEGLTQDLHVEHNDGPLLDTKAAIPDLSTAEKAAYKMLKAKHRRELKGEVAEAREACINARIADGWGREDANSAIKEKGELSGSAVIHLKDGSKATVADILRKPEVYNCKECLDPIEPGYRGGAVVGIIFANDGKIHSQAHGGKTYQLRLSAQDVFAKELVGAAQETAAFTEEMNQEVAHSAAQGIDTDEEERQNRIIDLLGTSHESFQASGIALKYEGKVLYDNDSGKWYAYQKGRWKRDELGMVNHLIRLACQNGAKATKKLSHINAVTSFCKRDPVFSIKASMTLDRKNYLLGTPAGVFDLSTGSMLAPNPLLYVSKQTRVAPSVEPGERFLSFLDEITLGDRELVEFLQVSLGACLSGAIESHWLLFWIGTGRNGKNTLGDLVMWIMGDYAKKIPATVLMSKDHESHPTEMANLMGCRLAVSSEIEQGAFWQEAKLNELTGDGTISARFMRQDFFEFERTHKHLVFGNNRPRLKTVTDALKARIKIVPFKASFLGREDPELPETLVAPSFARQ